MRKLRQVSDIGELMRLSPHEVLYYVNQEEILHWFDVCDAVWIHDGDPARPHAELTSGMCSNGFFDCLRVLCYPNINEILARQLAWKLERECKIRRDVDWVVGSAYAAITFSYAVARELGAAHWFVEKDQADPHGKKMVWKRLTIPASAAVLEVEELITTGRTVSEVQRAIREGNGEEVNFLPIVGALVHRPPKLLADYGGYRIISLVEKEIWAVKPEECPLCKVGSPRLRPKSHWKELTGKS